jgi:acetolactate synthase-1/2/3 large subunit
VAGDRPGLPDERLQELAVIEQEREPAGRQAAIDRQRLSGHGAPRWQQFFDDERYTGTPVWSPDFVQLAVADQIPALAVTRPDEVGPALEKAIATPGPSRSTSGSKKR